MRPAGMQVRSSENSPGAFGHWKKLPIAFPPESWPPAQPLGQTRCVQLLYPSVLAMGAAGYLCALPGNLCALEGSARSRAPPRRRGYNVDKEHLWILYPLRDTSRLRHRGIPTPGVTVVLCQPLARAGDPPVTASPAPPSLPPSLPPGPGRTAPRPPRGPFAVHSPSSNKVSVY